MPACTYGASVKAGEADWYYVQEADITTWFGSFPFLFQLWANGWVGRGYSLPLLALLNPNPPAVMPWTDLVISGLTGGRFGAVGTLGSAMDDLIAYHVFLDHCVCNAGTGPVPAYRGAAKFSRSAVNTGTVSILEQLDADAVGVWFKGTGVSTVTHNTVENYVNHWDATLSGLINAWLSSQSQADPATFDRDASFVGGPWTNEWLQFILGHAGGNVVAGTISGGFMTTAPIAYAPAAPGAVSTTGMPTVAVPSGTTSDQLMTQLLSQQYEIRSLSDQVSALAAYVGGAQLVAGTVHSGLSGDGEFACVSLAAIRVQLTGVPTVVDRWIAHPDEYHGAGSVSFTDGDGWTENVEVTHLDCHIPCTVPGTTKVGYHFLTGITATITEYPS